MLWLAGWPEGGSWVGRGCCDWTVKRGGRGRDEDMAMRPLR